MSKSALYRLLAAARPGPCSTIIGAEVPAHIRAAFDSSAAKVKPPAYLTSKPHPALDPSNALTTETDQ